MELEEYLMENDIKVSAFAKKIKRTRGSIYKFFVGELKFSATTAVQIEKATNGEVQREEIRPDLFLPME